MRDYLDNHDTPDGGICRALVSLAMMSTAKTCIVPIQDWLGLDNSCRMNTPSTIGCNWRWRVTEDQLTEELKEEIFNLTLRYGRMNWRNGKQT